MLKTINPTETHISMMFHLDLHSFYSNIHLDLYLSTEEGTNVYYYSLITDFSAFASVYVSKHRCRKFVCKLCFSNFNTEVNLQRHKRDCALNKCMIPVMPKPDDNTLQFKNFIREQRIPFAIYCDFECLL
uniref:C2H2-type domain-containing protein n=1 Tax=Cacopsylla melanoneura TaxID=428564 RepID=A0A8D8SQF1_9HEMI